MALQPRNPDIKFLDFVTLKTRCTFNQCRAKFAPCDHKPTAKTIQRGRPMAVKVIPVWACGECGAKVQETAEDAAGLD